MTFGQVIELLKGIFELLAEYLGKLFGKGDDEEATDEDTSAQA